MGRGGYNGGGPAANSPKNDLYILDTSHCGSIEIPENFEILESGTNLLNELGALQAEFGYIISISNTKQEASKPNSRSFKRLKFLQKKDKGKSSERWIIASSLLSQAPEIARSYHLKNPTAPKPYGFDDQNICAS